MATVGYGINGLKIHTRDFATWTPYNPYKVESPNFASCNTNFALTIPNNFNPLLQIQMKILFAGIPRFILRCAAIDKGKGKRQGEYSSEQRAYWRASCVGVGQSRLDLAATALCADRPLLPQQGSVYRSQLARMRPRCNGWESGSERNNGKGASYLLGSLQSDKDVRPKLKLQCRS